MEDLPRLRAVERMELETALPRGHCGREPRQTADVLYTDVPASCRSCTEDGAHASWRKLVGRLDYRQMLGPYGWVLQRQQNATLHYHGIAFLPFQTDGLALWRDLLTKSGFGIQNKLIVADAHHAGYIARYIARRKGLADRGPLAQSVWLFSRLPAMLERSQSA